MLTTKADTDAAYINAVGSITVIILYVKFFYFLRIFESTASYIKMIIQMTYDIRIFIYIYFFAILGFANGFYLLSLNNEPDDQFAPTLA